MSGARAGAVAVGLVAAAIGVGAVAYTEGVPHLAGALATAEEPAPAASAPEPAGSDRVVVLVTGPKRADRAPSADDAARNHSANPPATTVPPCASLTRQHDVEAALANLKPYRSVTVDGRQSPGDCAVIRSFQQRFGIEPARGQADATTADVAERIAASSASSGMDRCEAGPGVTACVDLTRQTAWVIRDGEVVVGPTVVRTGFRGHPTPTGAFTINKRTLREWSDPYGVWLPYWQRFIGGIGFHETTTYLHDGSLGSHGCVNLLPADAVRMWEELQSGSTVRVFGHRPGT